MARRGKTSGREIRFFSFASLTPQTDKPIAKATSASSGEILSFPYSEALDPQDWA